MRPNNNSTKPTLRLLAFDPLSVVGMVASKVVADSRVDGAVEIQSAVQSVRKRTAQRRNGRGIVPFMETAIMHFNRVTLNNTVEFLWSPYVIGGHYIFVL